VVSTGDPASGRAPRCKSFITDKGNLRPADPDGTATALQQVLGREPAKSASPFTSIKIDRSSGKYFGGRSIEIDLVAVRRDIASGQLPGVRVVEHRELMTLHHRNIELAQRANLLQPSARKARALEDAKTIARFSIRDQEALIQGTLPARYFRPATAGRDLERRASTYERRLADVPALIERAPR
jgi:hypothetical protein